MSHPSRFEDGAGWFGVVLVVVVYALNVLGLLDARSFSYVVGNIIGAGLIAFIAFRYKNFQSTTVNVVWVLIAVFAFIQLLI